MVNIDGDSSFLMTIYENNLENNLYKNSKKNDKRAEYDGKYLGKINFIREIYSNY